MESESCLQILRDFKTSPLYTQLRISRLTENMQLTAPRNAPNGDADALSVSNFLLPLAE